MIAPGDRVPDLPLPDLSGVQAPLSATWAEGSALIVVGHRNCKTTRQTLPYVDRIHRRRGRGHAVLLVLQDDASTARQLVADQGLEVPSRLDLDPYAFGSALDLQAVPTLLLVGQDGVVQRVSEAFSRADLEGFAAGLGVEGPLFAAGDPSPAYRPG